MARIRTIKPEFPQSESMGRVSRDARLCFILLWTIADDAGRLRGNSRMLASLLYPYDDDAKRLMDKWLSELETEGCITRYSVGADSYIQINGWTTHQKIDRPSLSKIPNPPEGSRELAKPREASSEDQGRDQGREGKGSVVFTTGFIAFWQAWPKSDRKQDKQRCYAKWIADDLEPVTHLILLDVEAKKLTEKWRTGFVELPMTYLNGRRWEDALGEDAAWHETRSGIEKRAAELGLGRWDEGISEHWPAYKARVLQAHQPGAH